MAQGHPANAVCDLFREHLDCGNQDGTHFSNTAATDSDFFRETGNIAGMPARTGHNPDQTAYSTQPVTDSWRAQVRGDTRIGVNANSGQGNLT